MDPFLISEARLAELAATRQGRVSLAGFNFQAAYAVARLSSMVVRRALLDLPDVPVRLRYDWGEDLDEACENGRVVFTQCKRMDSIGQPAKLATVLESFAAKWLFVPADKRSNVHFRLVCTDPRFSLFGLLKDTASDSKEECKNHFKANLRIKPGDKADRALWMAAADAFGHGVLFDQLWERCDAVFLPQDVVSGYPASPLLHPEKEALEILLSFSQIDASKQVYALSRLRQLVHDNLIAFDPSNEAPAVLAQHKPRNSERVDVANALASCAPTAGAGIPFDIVDRTFLSEQRQKPRQQFVARQPDWADVVHGADETIKFIERSVTSEVREKVVSELVEPLERGSEHRLHMLFVTGPPGSGKTTLVRRVSALLVEEGRIVVADAGVDAHEPAGSPDEYFANLERLAAAGRPVVFLLDDPLYADSPWIPVLKRLNRPTLRFAVLAPCPRIHFDQHKGSIPIGVIKNYGIGRPTEVERAEMKRLYGRETSALLSSDDFLVITMEAAAGIPFDEIISRLWQTLNNGKPVPDDWNATAWTLRAFMVVAFFHRAYTGCPEPILRSVLASGSDNRPTVNVSAELAKLRARDGWLMFRFNDPERANWAYQGALVYCAHQRIALRAWELRPLDWIDIGSQIVEASLSAPQTIRQIATLAARLHGSGNEADKSFASRLVDEWCREEHQGKLETRHLCEFVATLQTSGQRQIAQRFKAVLTARAQSSSDAWIAALQLCFLSGDTQAAQFFPTELDLPAIIGRADFSIAPSRATKFFSRLADQVKPVFTRQLLDAFDGALPWKSPSTLVVWLLRYGAPEEMLKRSAQIEGWLKDHPDITDVRTGYLGLLAKQGSNKERLNRVITDTEKWLDDHPDDTSVRNAYLSFLSNHKLTKEQLASVVTRTEQWLDNHVDDTNTRNGYLSFLSNHKLTKEQLASVVTRTEQWLESHSDDINVRNGYLGLLSTQDLTSQESTRIQTNYECWLAAHTDDIHVRSALEAFVRSQNWFGDHRTTTSLAIFWPNTDP